LNDWFAVSPLFRLRSHGAHSLAGYEPRFFQLRRLCWVKFACLMHGPGAVSDA